MSDVSLIEAVEEGDEDRIAYLLEKLGMEPEEVEQQRLSHWFPQGLPEETELEREAMAMTGGQGLRYTVYYQAM